MQQAVANTTSNVVQMQLDAIKKEGNRANEQELDLDNNGDLYVGLYENGISKEELAHRVLDQRNITDSKDYFLDKEQIQKANSYANFLINKQSVSIETKTEEHREEMKEEQERTKEEQTTKIEELTNILQDNTENAEKNAEKIVEQVKTRLSKTIGRYTNKMREINKANDTEKRKTQKRIRNNQRRAQKRKRKLSKC